MNSILERTSAFIKSPAMASLPLVKEQIQAQMAQSHEKVRDIIMDHVGINVDFSNFYLVVFTTLAVLVSAVFVSLMQKRKKGVEKNDEGIEIERVKEGYEEKTAPVIIEEKQQPQEQEPQPVVEEQPVAAVVPSNSHLDDSTGSISSQPIFFLNQVCSIFLLVSLFIFLSSHLCIPYRSTS